MASKECVTEEDGKHYALFYDDKDELVGKVHVKKTVEEWLEEPRIN